MKFYVTLVSIINDIFSCLLFSPFQCPCMAYHQEQGHQTQVSSGDYMPAKKHTHKEHVSVGKTSHVAKCLTIFYLGLFAANGIIAFTSLSLLPQTNKQTHQRICVQYTQVANRCIKSLFKLHILICSLGIYRNSMKMLKMLLRLVVCWRMQRFIRFLSKTKSLRPCTALTSVAQSLDCGVRSIHHA